MDQQKVQSYLSANRDYFPADKLVLLKQKLEQANDDQYITVSSVPLKSPTTLLLISLFLGYLGVDRFMLKDAGMGVLKLLTGGLCGILWIMDCVTISQKVREKNYTEVMTVL